MSSTTVVSMEQSEAGPFRVKIGAVAGLSARDRQYGSAESEEPNAPPPDLLLPSPYASRVGENDDDMIAAQTVAHSRADVVTRSLVRLYEGRSRARRFKVLQQWEGIVSELGDTTFWADLEDLTNQNMPRESVEISKNELDEVDRSLLQPGAVFYWAIGYEDRPSGRGRVSEIRMRRSPLWSPGEINRIHLEAENLVRKYAQPLHPADSFGA